MITVKATLMVPQFSMRVYQAEETCHWPGAWRPGERTAEGSGDDTRRAGPARQVSGTDNGADQVRLETINTSQCWMRHPVYSDINYISVSIALPCMMILYIIIIVMKIAVVV